jgi:hypothetical protein
MRPTSIRITAVVVTALFAMVLAASGRALEAGLGDMDQGFREGEVVSIDKAGDTITIREYGGVNTYELTPTGRQDVAAEQIKPGDRVRFMVYGVWGVAYKFWRL